MNERLQKLLARAGVASRRNAEGLIKGGRVTVNGVPATLGDRVSEGDEVRVDGKLLSFTAAEKVTFALYKPRGIVTSAHDELGRAGVLDFMPRVSGLHSVGRLDRDSEGLLLLTTDGELTLRLTHPRYTHEKVYRVWLAEGEPSASELEWLSRGVDLSEGRTLPAQVERAGDGLYISIREGRNRQVRRMLETVGYRVTRLVRVRFGGLFLGDLEPGEYLTLGVPALAALEDTAQVPPARWAEQLAEMHARWG